MPISEPEQLEITVLDGHFSGNAECVPIKKRRYLFKSPSPPPRASPVHSQEIDKLKMSDSGLAQCSNPDICLGVTADVASADGDCEIIDTDVVIDVKKSDVRVSSECFSGMSILADAACNNSLRHDDGFVELGPSTQDLTAHESSPQLLSMKESNFSLNGLSSLGLSSVNVPSEGTGSSITKGPFENYNGSSTEHTEAAGQDHISKDEGTLGTPQCSSHNDRLHWDLNIPMEEWVFPNEVVDPQTNNVEVIREESENVKLNNKMEDAEGDCMQRTPRVFKAETEKALPSTTQELKDSDKLECNVKASIKVEETTFLSEKEKPMSFDIRSSSDKDLVMEIKPLDHHETNRSDGLASSYSAEHAPKPSKSTNEDNSQCVSLGSTGSSGASSLHQVAEIAVYKSDKMVSPLLKDESDPVGVINVHPIKISSHDNTVDKIDSVSGTKSKCYASSSALTGKPSAFGFNDDVQRSYTSDIADNCEILDPKEHLKCKDNSDTLQNGSASLAGIQQTVDSQLDYDSQYEDGELRESAEPPWEECDVEVTEAELVDYRSDDGDMSEGAGQKNHQMPDISGSYAESDTSLKSFRKPKAIASKPTKQISARSCQPYPGPLASTDDAAVLADKKLDRGHERVTDNVDVSSLVDMKTTEASRDRSTESLKSFINTGVRGYNYGNNRSGSGIDAEGCEADIFQSRAFRREWQPRINGQTNQGILFRKDRQHGGRFRDYDDSELRYVGEWGTVKSFRTGTDSRHNRFQSWKANQGTDNRGLKRQLSPTYHLPTNFCEQGPESMTSVVSERANNYGRVRSNGDEHGNLTWIQSTGASSHGADGPMRRNVSPADRNRNVGMNLGSRPAGKFIDGSATGNRGGYIRRYGSRVDDKGCRGRYHEPVSDDCIESSSNYSHHFPSRERNFSPIGRRDLHSNCPSSKSPSKPGTHSPYRWQSPKSRNGASLADRPSLTHRSRSPDFRSQGRMVRARSPHQREDYSMSTTRRLSQQCNSRWIDDRVEAGRCREMDYKHHSSALDRQSPTRIFSSSKNPNIAESQQRLKQIEYSRLMNPGRASRLDRVGREEPRQEGSSDGKRHGNWYRTVHTLRRHDMDENLENLHYDNEDGFVAEHNCHKKDAAKVHWQTTEF